MKKVLAVGLVIIMILSFTACNNESKENSTKNTPTIESTATPVVTEKNTSTLEKIYTYDDVLEEKFKADEYAEEIHRFQTAIAELMYDYEYEVVKKLYKYYPNGVEDALEKEFGVKDIDAVMDYIQKRSETEVGICEFCGKTVYADEIVILPEGVECAHKECFSKNDDEKSFRINKVK